MHARRERRLRPASARGSRGARVPMGGGGRLFGRRRRQVNSRQRSRVAHRVSGRDRRRSARCEDLSRLSRGRRARRRFTTHGVYVEPGNGPVYKLFVVGHGARESIEVFRVDTAPAMPAVTWLGCVVAPDPIGLELRARLARRRFHHDELPAARRHARGHAAHAGRRAQRRALGMAHGDAAGRRCRAAKQPARTASSSRTTARRCTSRPGAANRSSACRAARRRRRATRSRSASASTTSTGRATARCAPSVRPAQSWKAVKIDPRTLAVRDVVTPGRHAGVRCGHGARRGRRQALGRLVPRQSHRDRPGAVALSRRAAARA